MNRELEEIIEDYENIRHSFKDYRGKGNYTKSSLIEFQGRFVDIKAELRPYKVEMVKEWIRRDDKAATAIKFRIAIAINKGEYLDEDGKIVFDCNSINQAEKFASGCASYKEFVDQRAFYKESLTNVSDLRNDCDSFANLTKDILRTL